MGEKQNKRQKTCFFHFLEFKQINGKFWLLTMSDVNKQMY